MSRRKDQETRLRRNKEAPLTIIRTDGPGERAPAVPGPEPGWSVATRTAWRTYWRDGLAQLTTPVDGVAVRRLFALYDARERLWQLFLRHPLATGSKGQEVMHPAGAFALAIDARVERMERAFGVTPKARAALGITFAEARASLEDLAREAAHAEEAEG